MAFDAASRLYESHLDGEGISQPFSITDIPIDDNGEAFCHSFKEEERSEENMSCESSNIPTAEDGFVLLKSYSSPPSESGHTSKSKFLCNVLKNLSALEEHGFFRSVTWTSFPPVRGLLTYQQTVSCKIPRL